MSDQCCVIHTRQDKKYESWCGRKTNASDWLFQNIDHVIYSIQQGSFVEPCDSCLIAIYKVLEDYLHGGKK